MKRITNSIVFFALIAAFAVPANAGTLYAGAQAWYSLWDSGMARLQADIAESAIRLKTKEYESQINNLVSSLGTFRGTEAKIEDPETKGYLAGPVLGYTTSDKLWTFELTAMLFGSYTSEMNAAININYSAILIGKQTVPVDISTELEIEQREINMEARRGLSDFFEVIAGYKYLGYETELNMDYDITILGTTLFTTENRVMFKSEMHMLYAGAGAHYSLMNNLNAKAGLSLGLPFYGNSENELIIDGTDFSTDYEIETAYFIMGNIALNYILSDTVSIDIGYHLRRLTLTVANVDKNLDGKTEDPSDYNDLFHGGYLSAVYLMDI